MDETETSEESQWIHGKIAARKLGYQFHSMSAMGARHGFQMRRRWDVPGYPFFYLREEIEAYAAILRHRKSCRKFRSPLPPEHYVEKMSEADALSAKFLSTSEAAEILQISRVRVVQLVQLGKLCGYQNVPGRQGSKLYLSRTEVGILATDEERLRRRQRWERADRSAYRMRQVGTEIRLRTSHPALPPGVLTGREAAAVLGISPGTLSRLRKRGKLSGFHALYGKREGGTREGKWWYYSEREVWELLQHEDYRERRVRAEATLKARAKKK